MDTLLKILSEYGLPGFLLVLVITIVFRVLAKDYKYQLGHFVQSLSNSEVNTELRYHPFFSSAHHKVVAEIPTLELAPTKPVKQQMFRDIITIYIKSMIHTCTEIVSEDMTDWSGEKWANEVSKNLNRMVTDFKTTSVDSGVPEEAINKFLKWHYPTLEMMYEYITMLGNSTVYNTYILRTNTFLMTMNLLLVTTLGDAERSLKELNGEVGGKLYKNMVLEH